VSKVEETYLPI